MTAKPMFTGITQVAMVVHSVEATAKKYYDDLGIGPWRFYTIEPETTGEMTLRGRPVKHAFRAALTKVGDVSMELIEPLEGESLYAEHLAQHGEGLHHVAFAVDNYEDTKRQLKDKGYQEVQSGRTFNCCSYSYFNTDQALGCLAEFGSGIEEGKAFPEPEKTYP